MPTPSSSAPEPPSPRSPRTFSFSTCPDPDEPSSQSHHGPSQSLSRSPASGWRRYFGAVRVQTNDRIVSPRSATMSPGPQTDLSGEPGTEQEARAVVLIPGNSVEEDGPKQTSLDEDMLGVTTESNRDTDGESSRARAAIRISDRGKQRADLVSPCTVDSDEVDMMDIEDTSMRWTEDSGLAGMGYEYSQVRVIPNSPSSFLRPGSRFTGTQQSERQRYDVKVEIKHVDLRESFLCGYLKIQGLTEEHPTLTTYFEAEIIGPKYGFITQHPSWGAAEKIDLSHWAKFPAFRPFQKQARKGGHVPGDMAGRECIFMRWKEHFLVPDHRVRTIIGASFEGFYYICFNQMRGEISGIYYHSRSEKFQQLELKHVEDRGCFGAVEFR